MVCPTSPRTNQRAQQPTCLRTNPHPPIPTHHTRFCADSHRLIVNTIPKLVLEHSRENGKIEEPPTQRLNGVRRVFKASVTLLIAIVLVVLTAKKARRKEVITYLVVRNSTSLIPTASYRRAMPSTCPWGSGEQSAEIGDVERRSGGPNITHRADELHTGPSAGTEKKKLYCVCVVCCLHTYQYCVTEPHAPSVPHVIHTPDTTQQYMNEVVSICVQ